MLVSIRKIGSKWFPVDPNTGKPHGQGHDNVQRASRAAMKYNLKAIEASEPEQQANETEKREESG